jgi:hypothetical protein
MTRFNSIVPATPGVEQIASARGLFDELLERQLQQQRKRDYGLPSNARDLGADF